jgi:hypothetical protein
MILALARSVELITTFTLRFETVFTPEALDASASGGMRRATVLGGPIETGTVIRCSG